MRTFEITGELLTVEQHLKSRSICWLRVSNGGCKTT
jgi:hypothetical protein